MVPPQRIASFTSVIKHRGVARTMSYAKRTTRSGLLVVETLTQAKSNEARDRLARAYKRAEAVDAEATQI